MAKREDVPREQVPDGRVGQKHGIEPLGRTIFGQSPVDSDLMTKFTVPDCAYKGYDPFTWPEGKACEYDLPGETEERQSAETEEIKPNK